MFASFLGALLVLGKSKERVLLPVGGVDFDGLRSRLSLGADSGELSPILELRSLESERAIGILRGIGRAGNEMMGHISWNRTD